MAVFYRNLLSSRKTILGWGLALACYALVMALFFPIMDSFEEIDAFIEVMPDFFKTMFGDMEDLTSPPGFLTTYLFSYGQVILGVYGILAGAAAVAGEEKRGTMDLLMSAPVPRWRVIVEKYAAFAVALVAIVTITYIGLALGIAIIPEMDADMGRALEATLNLIPFTLLFGALAFFLSAGLPGRISAAMVSGVLLIAFYFLNTLSELSEALKPFQAINPFHYYGMRTMFDGINWGNVAVLLAASAAFVTLAVYSFQRRDLSV